MVIGAVAQAAAAITAVTLDLNTIILAVIGLIGTTVTSVVALRMKEIHTAVNSSKTILDNKLDVLHAQNAEWVKKVSILEEKLRGVELAKAVASAPPGMVVLPAVAAPVVIQAPAAMATPVPLPEATKTIAAIASAVEVAASAPTRMGDAIVELKAAAEETSVAAEEASIKADKTVAIVDKQHGKGP